MSYPSVSPRSYQIDVVDHVGRAYRAVIDHAQLAGEMALLPYLIVLAAEFAAVLLPGDGMFSRGLAALIDAVGFLVFGSVFLVRWYRFVLLGESVGGGLIPPGWTGFLIAGVKLGAVVVAGWIALLFFGLLPPHFLTFPVAMIGGVALALFTLRVSLIFPAAAIERPVALRTAWDWLAGNFWRLFACVFACSLPFIIAQMLIGAIASVFPSLAWIIFEAATLAVSFAGAAVIAALFAHLYRDITGVTPPI